MKEKLIIKNFGPIKSIELDLGRFNLLIGENATGKSIIAKLLGVCKYFSYILDENLYPNAFEDGLKSRGIDEFIQKDTYIFYECEHYSFQAERSSREEIDIDQQNGKIISQYQIPFFQTVLKSKSNEFGNLLDELNDIRPEEKEISLGYFEEWTIPTSFFQSDVAAVLTNPFYVPTERGLQSIFSLGKSSIRNLSDALFNQLAELDHIAREFKKETKIEPLEITYKNDNGIGYVKKDNSNTFFSLFNAASGYQSTIPIVLLVMYYTEIRKKKKAFIIEEPELNLFPAAQNKLMKYLADRTINYHNSTLLTTHSPYILTSLNNLMEAYKSGQLKSKETAEIIENKYWINPDVVSAYMMLSDGTCEDIFDREEGLIKAEKIDSVSNILNEQFSSLLNLEFSENEFDTN